MTLFVVEGSTAGLEEPVVRRIGEFERREEAIACAKRTIDAFLLQQYRPGMVPRDLYARYERFGEQPFIFQDDNATLNVSGFTAPQYARKRCEEYCGTKDP